MEESKTRSSKRYFVALLPPDKVAEEVTEIKQFFDRTYNSHGALKSPPHITLQPPFHWEAERLTVLTESLAEFTQWHYPIPITLSGFGAFPPRVIYVNVLKTPELMQVRASLFTYLTQKFESIATKADRRSFSPHMTVAFRDLKKHDFYDAWPQFQTRSLSREFTVSHLTLLVHDGRQWQVDRQFPFLAT
ncbi:MAG: 2'-5' RNA ligase family protein [Cyanobacteriota bacterium]|nr:2'-5' RNA ligase family protein [Cyanobacteriota bacterium]